MPEALALQTITEVEFGIDKSYLERDHAFRHFAETAILIENSEFGILYPKGARLAQ